MLKPCKLRARCLACCVRFGTFDVLPRIVLATGLNGGGVGGGGGSSRGGEGGAEGGGEGGCESGGEGVSWNEPTTWKGAIA